MPILALWISTIAISHIIGCLIVCYAYFDTFSALYSHHPTTTVLKVQPSGEVGKKSTMRLEVLAGLCWSGVGCEVKVANTVKKCLLHNSFGAVQAGECAGLMGPSGAGKSTLLDVLAQRKRGVGVNGTILLNDAPVDSHFQLVSAYVTQDDVFVAQLSALETLRFYAALTLPARVSAKDRKARVVDVLAILGLAHVGETKVGGVLPGGLTVRGLSGGERRRLSIACCLVSQPSLIFLDEPTTGLDSFAALNIMEHISSLARLGHCIIASIHQPRNAIFEKFDKVCLLSEGRQVYFGAPAAAAAWFSHIGYSYPSLAQSEGLSDWLLDLVSIGFHKPAQGSRTMRTMEDVLAAAECFRTAHQEMVGPISDVGIAIQKATASRSGEVTVPIVNGEGLQRRPKRRKTKYNSSWQRQFTVLLQRCLLEQLRNPFDTALRLILGCWIGILAGLVFYNLADGPSGSFGRVSLLFFNLLSQLLLPFSYMSFYVANRRFYIADVAAGIYAPSSYYAAAAVAAFPFVSLNAILGALTAYGLAGLRETAHAIALHGLFAALQGLVGTQLLIAFVYMSSNQDLAYLLATSYATISILLSGFYIRLKNIDLGFVRALSWISCTKYALIGTAQLEFKGVVTCINTGSCLETGNDVLQEFGFTLPAYAMILAMLAFLVALHTVSFLALSGLHKSGK